MGVGLVREVHSPRGVLERKAIDAAAGQQPSCPPAILPLSSDSVRTGIGYGYESPELIRFHLWDAARQRWTENCLDLTGRPLRRRVSGYARYGCIGPGGGKSPLASARRTATPGTHVRPPARSKAIYCYHDTWPRRPAALQRCTNDINGNVGRYYWVCSHPTEDCEHTRFLLLDFSTLATRQIDTTSNSCRPVLRLG